MSRVRVIYHWEPEGFWAESPDVAGFSAADASFDDLRRQVRDGLEFHFGARVELTESFDELESAWSVSQPTSVERGRWSALWRQVTTYGTCVTGATTFHAQGTSIIPVTVGSNAAYSGS